MLLLFIYLLLIIPIRPIISKSTGPVFVKFSGLVQCMAVDEQPKISFLRDVAMATNFVGFIHRTDSLDAGGYRVGQKIKLLYCDRYFKGYSMVLMLNTV